MLDFYILSVILDPTMDKSQSLNAPPFFDESNYAFWKVRMRAFLCSIDDSVWDAVEDGWTRPEAAKSTWDKATLPAANANSKALSAILVVSHSMNFIGFHMLQLPRRRGKFWRPHMKEPKR